MALVNAKKTDFCSTKNAFYVRMYSAQDADNVISYDVLNANKIGKVTPQENNVDVKSQTIYN